MTPTTARYLEQLPEGLASYPSAEVKGAVFKGMLEELTEAFVPDLPEPIRAEVEAGILVSNWYPETYYGCVVATARDLLYLGSEEAHRRGSVDRNVRLFESKLYYRLMRMLSIPQLVRRSASLWVHFHRGTSLELESVREEGGEIFVHYPPGLFLDEQLTVVGGSIEAALRFNGRSNAHVRILKAGAGKAKLAGTW